MIEVRQFDNGRIELVSDDAKGENGAVSDVLSGTQMGDRWDGAPFEDGELVIALSRDEAEQVEGLFAGSDEHGYLFGDVLAQLDDVAHADG